MPDRFQEFKELLRTAGTAAKQFAVDAGLYKDTAADRYDKYIQTGDATSLPPGDKPNTYVDLDPTEELFLRDRGTGSTAGRTIRSGVPLGSKHPSKKQSVTQYVIEKKYPANTLVIRGHGGDVKGKYSIGPSELSTAQFEEPIALEDLVKRPGIDRFAYHNILLNACNESGSLCPEDIAAQFPVATNIVMVPKGTGSRIDLQRKLIHDQAIVDDPFYTPELVKSSGISDLASFQKQVDSKTGQPVWRRKHFGK